VANVLLGVTGSVAAVRAPALYAALRDQGLNVKVVATNPSLYFFDPREIGRDNLVLDEDEWPGRGDGERYERGGPVPHIELRRWADLFVIAPLDANTLAKLANGLCDNCLTCVWRAWEPTRPVVLAPAMNTLMWRHPLTRRHLRQIAFDAGAAHVPSHLDESAVIDVINDRSPTLRIVPPQSKQLACGDVGVGAMAEVDAIVGTTLQLLASFTTADPPGDAK
jgi:phosphopantothenoylcysteine decarboxylase